MKAADRAASLSTVLVSLTACPSLAQAHSPIEGLGTFYSHVLHPVTVLSHALLLTAVSLMLGQQGRSTARVAIVALGGTFVAGLAIATAGGINVVREQVMIITALLAGGLVCLDRRVPIAFPVSVAAGTGLAIGLDSGVNMTGLRDTALAVAGVAVGVLYLAVVVAGLTADVKKQWQRVAIRIGGSWIFAVSILVLALSISGPTKRVGVIIGSFIG